MSPLPVSAPVLYFDGVCNFCDASVKFVLEHERVPVLQFASLQSTQALQALPALGIEPTDLDTVVLVEGGKAYTQSSAALQTAKYLKAPWRWLSVFLWVPKPLRDLCYKVVARNRYRLFGKKDECSVPSPQLRARFL